MQFQVPQFIEYEIKIVGPLTFKNFIIVFIGAVFSLFLFFYVPFSIFVFVSATIMSFTFALVFLKVNGLPLPTVLKSFFSFSVSPKIYLWKKKEILPTVKISKKIPEEKTEADKEPTLKIAGRSQLKKIKTVIETGLR